MKIFEGVVKSLGTQNTAVVEVSRKTPHKLYRKLMKISKKYKADTGGLSLSIGQVVRIGETRPISKGKHFKVVEEKKEDKK